MVSYPACQGALQSRHCVSNRWTCKNSTADTECVLSHSVTVPLHSHLTLSFLHSSSDSVPLLVPPSSSLPHPITEQHSGTLTPPRPTIDNVVHMLMKEPISENDFFLFTEQKNTNWLFKVMREPPHTKPNDLAEMFTFQLLMWVLCRQNPN